MKTNRLNTENENHVENPIEDGNSQPNQPDPHPNDGDDDGIIIGLVVGDTTQERTAKVLEQYEENCALHTRVIKVVNNILHKEEYDLITVTINAPVAAMVAGEDDEFVESSTKRLTMMVSSVIAAIKDNDILSRYYNIVKNDPEKLYTLLPGLKFGILEMKVPANKRFVNPYSESGTPKEYEEDRILHFPAEVKEVPTEVLKLWKLNYLLNSATLSGDAIMSLI